MIELTQAMVARIENTRYPQCFTSSRQAVASTRLHAAVRKGEVAKTPCDVCGAKYVFGHIPHYDEPLVVLWLCRRHIYALRDAKQAAARAAYLTALEAPLVHAQRAT